MTKIVAGTEPALCALQHPERPGDNRPPVPSPGLSLRRTLTLRNNGWTKTQLAALRSAWKNPDTNVRQFASTLGRTDGAVRQKAHALGLHRKRVKPAKAAPKPLKATKVATNSKLKAAASRKKPARRSSR
jgi:hypothetical protein